MIILGLTGWVIWAATGASLPIASALARAGGACRPNFRGQPVPVGIGVVPTGWIVTALVLGAAVGFVRCQEALAAVFLAQSLCLLGWLDDQWGDRQLRGLKGHLGALMRGHWSTGSVKALGGVAAAFISAALLIGDAGAGPQLQSQPPWSEGWTGPGRLVLGVGRLVLAAACMAGTANVVNLLDVRPGRAWKALLLGWGAVAAALALRWWQQGLPPNHRGLLLLSVASVASLAAYGPWDLRARVMMGDAGANPLGGLLGLGVVWVAPWSWQSAYLAGILLLHGVSERRSLTQLIEAVPLLRRLDAWGRPPQAGEAAAPEAWAAREQPVTEAGDDTLRHREPGGDIG